MENLKIRVNGEVENKEAQGIFKILGGSWSEHVNADHYDKEFLYLTNGVIEYDDLLSEFLAVDECEEITLPELRDMVVLKRNDESDATHEDGFDGKFRKINDTWHWFKDGCWSVSEQNQHYHNKLLKPIEKKMKEYLVKSQDSKWRLETDLVCDPADTVIEVPNGAEAYLVNPKVKEFLKNINGGMQRLYNGEWIKCLDSHINYIDHDFNEIVWWRETLNDQVASADWRTHPEELPFIDDECYTNKSDGGFRLPKVEPCDMSKWVEHRGESLDDQYAEIEKVRQSAWQKQEGGSHYKNLKIQPMQYALENKLDYAQANVVKYVTRHKEKNGKEDLLKAIHNIELMIEFYYGGGE